MLKNKGILTIDLAAVVHNYNVLKAQAAPGARVAAVVKANGYGLGSVAIGRVLAAAGCGDFFVSSFEEGLVLRGALKEPRIYVLNGFYGSVAEAYAEHNLIPALGSFLEIEDYRKLAAKLGRKLDAFLSFNIRMNRLGLGKAETEKLIADKSLLEGINIAGVLSHFACADEDSPLNDEQHEIFEKITRHFPDAEKSLSNSFGTFRNKKYHYDLLRPGMALYGLNPRPGSPNPMRRVVSLNLPVMRLRLVYKGAGVGYGMTWHAEKDTLLATVAAGYADGIFRSLSNKGALYWKGMRCPVRGRVSMDLTTVDISGVPEKQRPKPGDMMELIGEHQSADDLANDAGTIGYEVLTDLGHRYERVYVGDDIMRMSGGKSSSASGA
ncbi:MAG: alanine racemase [Alphaproteobacteria bacterium PRO2]|nr:alanine racemase [Alphaproteobacteria bacterium PRO2]